MYFASRNRRGWASLILRNRRGRKLRYAYLVQPEAASEYGPAGGPSKLAFSTLRNTPAAARDTRLRLSRTSQPNRLKDSRFHSSAPARWRTI